MLILTGSAKRHECGGSERQDQHIKEQRLKGNNDNKQQYIENVCLKFRDNGERGLNGHKEASGLVLV